MNLRDLTIPYEVERVAYVLSRRTCSHCRKRAEILSSGETCPETYSCPFCKSLWVFVPELRIDAEDLYSLSDEERQAILSDENLLGIDLVWD
jgi:hypothetical protein